MYVYVYVLHIPITRTFEAFELGVRETIEKNGSSKLELFMRARAVVSIPFAIARELLSWCRARARTAEEVGLKFARGQPTTAVAAATKIDGLLCAAWYLYSRFVNGRGRRLRDHRVFFVNR